MSGQPMMYTGSPCGCSGQYMNSGQNMNSGQYMNDGQFRNEGQNTNDGSYNNYEGSNDSAVVEPPASDDGSYTSTEKSVSERANSGNDGVEPPPVPTDNDDQ